MSHFTVLAVTPTNPADSDVLQKVMQPYHEFECTGTNDEYVLSLVKTDKVLEAYAKDTERRLQSPDGKLYVPWDDHFYRDPTPEERKKMGKGPHGSGCGHGLSWDSRDWGDGKGYRTKIKFIPEGFVEVTVPSKDILTIGEYIEGEHSWPKLDTDAEPDLEDKHKYGWYRLDADGNLIEAVDRTNPDRKWDWWVIGGRWQKKLLLKDGASVDSARKADLDMPAMLEAERARRTEVLNDALHKIVEKTNMTRDDILALHAAAVAIWKSTVKVWEDNGKTQNLWDYIRSLPEDNPLRRVDAIHLWDDWGTGFPTVTWSMANPFQWVDNAHPLVIFGMLKDGEWHERGHMGWWGCVSDEKEDWETKFDTLLASVPDDHWVTVVDCHI